MQASGADVPQLPHMLTPVGLFSCLEPIFATTAQPKPCCFQWGSFEGEMVLLGKAASVEPGRGTVQRMVDKGGCFRPLGV